MNREKHNAYMKIYSKEVYQWHKKNGICTVCGNRIAMEGFTRCPECSEKVSEWGKKYYEKNKDKVAKQYCEYRKNKVLNGICRECNKPVCEKSKYLCNYHRLKQNERARLKRKRNGAISNEVASALGLCFFCRKNKVIAGKKVCADCYEVKRNQMIKIMALGQKKSKENGWNWR